MCKFAIICEPSCLTQARIERRRLDDYFKRKEQPVSAFVCVDGLRLLLRLISGGGGGGCGGGTLAIAKDQLIEYQQKLID